VFGHPGTMIGQAVWHENKFFYVCATPTCIILDLSTEASNIKVTKVEYSLPRSEDSDN
jgi:hypothetical protein